MSELLSFTIAFDGNKSAYTGGEIVSGCALIVLKAPMNVRAINIKFVGKSKVMWTVQQDKTSRTYNDSETYFDNSLCVYGQGCIGLYQNATQLPAGQSCFPFQYQLPAQLPASLEEINLSIPAAIHGSVRYDVIGVINRPYSRDCKTNVRFSVYDLMDLNHIRNIRMPIHVMDSKHRCCCCCASGEITAEVHTDKSGYVPGEYITINASVENLSSSKIHGTNVALIQVITYIAQGVTNKTHKTITECRGPGVKKRKTMNLNDNLLKVPMTQPSYLRFCKVMYIEYYLQFTVMLPAFSLNLRLNAPLTIGSIPIQSVEQSYHNAGYLNNEIPMITCPTPVNTSII